MLLTGVVYKDSYKDNPSEEEVRGWEGRVAREMGEKQIVNVRRQSGGNRYQLRWPHYRFYTNRFLKVEPEQGLQTLKEGKYVVVESVLNWTVPSGGNGTDTGNAIYFGGEVVESDANWRNAGRYPLTNPDDYNWYIPLPKNV